MLNNIPNSSSVFSCYISWCMLVIFTIIRSSIYNLQKFFFVIDPLGIFVHYICSSLIVGLTVLSSSISGIYTQGRIQDLSEGGGARFFRNKKN